MTSTKKSFWIQDEGRVSEEQMFVRRRDRSRIEDSQNEAREGHEVSRGSIHYIGSYF